MNEEGTAPALHHAIGRNRRINPSGDQTSNLSTDSHWHPARPLKLSDCVVNLLGEQFKKKCEVGVFQTAFLASYFTDGSTDLPCDFHGGEGQAFVGSFRRDTKGGKRFRPERFDNCLADCSQIWLGQIERQPMGKKKISNPEDAREPVCDGLVRSCVREDDANAAVKILDTSDTEVFQHPLDIAHELLLEVFPVAAFEGKFVVVNNSASHVIGEGLFFEISLAPHSSPFSR